MVKYGLPGCKKRSAKRPKKPKCKTSSIASISGAARRRNMSSGTRKSQTQAEQDRNGEAPATAATAPPRPPHSRTIELLGHIIDSHVLSQVMDLVMDYNAEFYVEEFDVGRHKFDRSYARLALYAATPDALDDLVEAVGRLGAQLLESEETDARTVPA